MLLNPKGSIRWTELDFALVSNYHNKATGAKDKIDKFIFSWIIMNHYYSIWSFKSPNSSWAGRKRAPSERDEVRHFVSGSKIWVHF